jgi:hypothetical protein
MDATETRTYERPKVVDYGDLQELTAACLGATGGDAATRANGGYAGVSAPAFGCKSLP